jgi:hypothetical protein
MTTDVSALLLGATVLSYAILAPIFQDASLFTKICFGAGVLSFIGVALGIWLEFYSKAARDAKFSNARFDSIPDSLLSAEQESAYLGMDTELKTSLYLPRSIRRRHVHIIGATGSGKTESVILNLLFQDVACGAGAIILDAKGDHSILTALENVVPKERILVFDLGSNDRSAYNPLREGTDLEAAQRLFSSLNWSEQYYQSKAQTALFRLFQNFRARCGQNPTLRDLSFSLEDSENFSNAVRATDYPDSASKTDYKDLAGLKDQIRTLCSGHLAETLSPPPNEGINLSKALKDSVIYFRLQSLMSPALVTTVGKLVVNNLAYLAGSSHRDAQGVGAPFCPVFLDEFASFASPEFADLISKARSAGFALHFSHQSVGDLMEVSPGFLSRISDNSATKIVLRVNDPDTAEYFSRTFGTRRYQKVTRKLDQADDVGKLEFSGEGSSREANQFKAPPDLLKTLPTGEAAVLIAHGEATSEGAAHVFRVKLPRLDPAVSILRPRSTPTLSVQ